MAITVEQLEARLKQELDADHVHIVDASGGCGQSFIATIVSGLFAGKTTLQRHRLVNTAIKDVINQVHAFTQTTYTPAEWAGKQAKA